MAFFLMTGEDRDRGGDKQTEGRLEDAGTWGIEVAGRSETLILFWVVQEEMKRKTDAIDGRDEMKESWHSDPLFM